MREITAEEATKILCKAEWDNEFPPTGMDAVDDDVKRCLTEIYRKIEEQAESCENKIFHQCYYRDNVVMRVRSRLSELGYEVNHEGSYSNLWIEWPKA